MKHSSNTVIQAQSSPPEKRIRNTQARRPGGSIYRRPGSEFWWIKYFRHGKCFRESTKRTDYGQAEKVLKNRLGQINTGQFLGLQVERILMDELAEQLFADYRNNGKRSLSDVQARWNLHLKREFSGLRAVDVSTAYVRDYISKRRAQGASNASINRELAMLSHMFLLGDNKALQARAPSFKLLRLREDNRRRGFLKDGVAELIIAHCPELWFRSLVECGRTYGWRVGELLGLRVGQVDLTQRIVRLEPGTTKNRDPREVVMTDTIYQLLAALVHGKRDSDAVFTRNNGKAVRDFRATWSAACCAAGVGWMVHRGCWDAARQAGLSAEDVALDAKGKCPQCSAIVKARQRTYHGLIFHDLRRTAARNLSRAGVPEKVVMQIGGWRTRSVFERYRIIDRTDMTEAALRIERAEQERKKSAASESEPGGAASRAHSGHSLGSVAPKTGKQAVN